mgnify:CR=1 FL=1
MAGRTLPVPPSPVGPQAAQRLPRTHRGGYDASMSDPTDLAKLDELLEAIRGYDDPRRAASEWKQVYRLLGKTELPAGRVTAVVGMRDVPGLVELLERLRGGGAGPEPEIDPETLRKALHAFRKRLKLTVLDEESKLGRGPLSKEIGRAHV